MAGTPLTLLAKGMFHTIENWVQFSVEGLGLGGIVLQGWARHHSVGSEQLEHVPLLSWGFLFLSLFVTPIIIIIIYTSSSIFCLVSIIELFLCQPMRFTFFFLFLFFDSPPHQGERTEWLCGAQFQAGVKPQQSFTAKQLLSRCFSDVTQLLSWSHCLMLVAITTC